MDKQLLRYEGSKKTMFIIGLLTVFQSVFIILHAVFLSTAITKLFKGAAVNAVLPFLFGFGGFFFLRHLLQWTKERMAYRFAETTALSYQTLLLEKLFRLGPRGVGRHGSGSVITLCLEGITNFRTYLELFIPRAVSMICIPLFLLVYVFTVDALSGVVLLVTMPIMIAFLILLGLLAQKKIDAQMDSYRLLSSHFVDSLRGLVTLKFLGKSKSHEHAIRAVSERYRMATNRTLRLAFLSTFALDFFSSLSVAVVAVELGLRLIDGKIGLESALMLLILAPEYFLPIRSFGNDYHATMDGKDAGDKIHEILSQEDRKLISTQPLPRWNEASYLAVRGLSKASTEDESFIVKNLDFEVKGFQKIGIVGQSGAGKSTFIDLLAGLRDKSSGTILFDGIEVESFTVDEWQRQLSYIPQHPYIFSGTVAENIRWYAQHSSKEDLLLAVERAGLSELVKSLPNGLDEKIGQGGRSLSGGEEQRIALARTILQERPIMLFDEPTAHLDIETEYEIKELLLPLLERKLVFFATHRLHWMKEMDLIFVLQEGQLVECGSHEQLLAKKGHYFELISAAKGGRGV
ncbi:thiol reductant ABC exporter subunit CydD [Robertmurraya andreesenii]|uniref:ATP-binding cassette subfamily C protein CydD n=1 Tax=Anoxybacillus andreesenii TaxID=1325932 RepID=A0ABT9V5K8_9BACL|nr:thiol reductant ABC exporter subunit CydD [Robertmurraya andreesenii]MDQ0156235.1 ATP-binding cassette subfamily C protein CydD [Robertmurraya andreesenii]